MHYIRKWNYENDRDQATGHPWPAGVFTLTFDAANSIKRLMTIVPWL